MQPSQDHAGRPAGALVGGADPNKYVVPVPTSPRYPDFEMPYVGSQEQADQRFADALEAFLVDYGYNTARAYRTDLVDIYLWAKKRGINFFQMSEANLKPYLALLRRRGYSEGTVRRRSTAWRGMYNSAAWARVDK